jgi:sterol desaturase/sphingolipid hydroxylase (fatty acid hydroxylase superfamily)
MPLTDPALTFLAYGLVLAGLAVLEHLVPARRQAHSEAGQGDAAGWAARPVSNVVLGAMNWGLTRLAGPLGLVAVAVWADAAGFGLVPGLVREAGLPGPDAPWGWLTVLVCWMVLDAAIWAQHVAFHKVPLLWRLHRVHHADPHMDLTTGVRFHPGEAVLSQLWKAGAVALLGAPVEAVVLFQLALGIMALVTHANIALPPAVERAVSLVLVTPALHLRHHHPDPGWTDSTYGNVFSLWDRLAGTLAPAPPDPRIGLGRWQEPADQHLLALLLQPLVPLTAPPIPLDPLDTPDTPDTPQDAARRST